MHLNTDKSEKSKPLPQDFAAIALSPHQIRLIAHALSVMRSELTKSALWGAPKQAAEFSIEEIAEVEAVLAARNLS